MVPMATNTDEWIADVANYVRNAFGNSGRPLIAPEQVATLRKNVTRRSPWTLGELAPTIPTPLTNQPQWTLMASHNVAATSALRCLVPDAGTPRRPKKPECGSRSNFRRRRW